MEYTYSIVCRLNTKIKHDIMKVIECNLVYAENLQDDFYKVTLAERSEQELDNAVMKNADYLEMLMA